MSHKSRVPIASELDQTVSFHGRQGDTLDLVVIGDGVGAVHALPKAGSVTIGRDKEADICIRHKSISRKHAAIHLGQIATIEDLGSANGTFVRGARLPKGQSAAIAVGESITLGPVMIVIQQAWMTPERENVSREEDVKERPLDMPNSIVVLDGRMRQLYRLVQRVAVGHINVLLTGETGVGKEIVAEQLHRFSPRARKPLVRINCAALTESLLESELFGHERGAFTGANHSKPGLLEVADGGTVFLDEIGELPMTMQAKLLRVLEDGQVRRVGAVTPRSCDIRFVSATNRDLKEAVRNGTFRQDLYFRLNGVSILIPPLRERMDELEPLAMRFLEGARQQGAQQGPVSFAPETLELFRAHPWPGNIRELKNVILRAVLYCQGPTILPAHVGLEEVKPRKQVPSGIREELTQVEKQRILTTLEECGGNKSQAAKRLGIARNTLISRLIDYGLMSPDSRDRLS